MVRNDGAETRKARIAEVAKIVNSLLQQAKEKVKADNIPLRRTVAKIMVDTGLTKPKVMEYLQLKNDEGVFEIDETADKISRVSV